MEEINALEQINEIMKPFSSAEQRCMIWWLNARLIQHTNMDAVKNAVHAATTAQK